MPAARRDDDRGRARPTSSARASGKGARRRSPRWAACRRTTTCRTASCRARSCRRCCAGSATLEARSGLRIGNVFHAGDGNLHPLICYDEAIPGQAEHAEQVAVGNPHVLHRRRRLDHRRARRRRRQEGVHADDVRAGRSRRDAAACACAFDPHGHLQSRQGVSDAAAVRRSARPVPAASGRARPAWPSDSDGRLTTSSSRADAGDGRGAAARDGGAARRLSVVSRGAGTKLAGAAARSASTSMLSTRRLNRPSRTAPAIWWRRSPAGATLARRERRARGASGQWLPLDPPFADRATIGGILATNDSGPRRHATARRAIWSSASRSRSPTARVAKAGGRVVKNVAGYDLSKLLCGSFGSLAVITSATFKLAPLPPASKTIVVTRGPGRASAGALTWRAPLTPTAARPRVRFRATAARAVRNDRRRPRHGSRDRARDQRAAPARPPRRWTARAKRSAWRDARGGGVGRRRDGGRSCRVLPTEVAATLARARRAATRRRQPRRRRPRSRSACCTARLEVEAAEQTAAIAALRREPPRTTDRSSSSTRRAVAHRRQRGRSSRRVRRHARGEGPIRPAGHLQGFAAAGL